MGKHSNRVVFNPKTRYFVCISILLLNQTNSIANSFRGVASAFRGSIDSHQNRNVNNEKQHRGPAFLMSSRRARLKLRLDHNLAFILSHHHWHLDSFNPYETTRLAKAPECRGRLRKRADPNAPIYNSDLERFT